MSDSYFEYTFFAATGDQWGGFFYDDSLDYAPGSVVNTTAGSYVVSYEWAFGYDLGPAANEGDIYATWYWDAGGGQYLSIQNAGGRAGTGGMGSEIGAAWNGTAWDDFGQGGARQVTATERPDSYFEYTFRAWSGDQWGGYFYDDSTDYAPGSVIQASGGTYTINYEWNFGYDLGWTTPEGQTFATWYWDADSRQYLDVKAPGATAGWNGPGSEYAHAWNGAWWDDFGWGGAYQATADLPDSYFTYTFYAYSGDVWGGYFYDDSIDYWSGQTVWADQGYFIITDEWGYDYDIGWATEGYMYTSWYDEWDDGGVSYWHDDDYSYSYYYYDDVYDDYYYDDYYYEDDEWWW